MSETRHAGCLTWAQARKAAAVLKAARLASRRRQEDVAAGLGWTTDKVRRAENAMTRMLPADALALAAAVGADMTGLLTVSAPGDDGEGNGDGK